MNETSRRRPRYRLTTLLLLIFVCCMTSVGGRMLLYGLPEEKTLDRARFVFIVLILPGASMIVANLFYRCVDRQRP